MTVMSGNLYRALKSVDVSDDLAQKAAEEVADFHNQFAAIRSELTVMKVMLALILGGVVSLVLKAFF